MTILETLNEQVPGSRLKRWQYHLTKVMVSAPVTLVGVMIGIPLLWSSVIAAIVSVVVIHGIYHLIDKYEFNVKDTVFDIVISGLTIPIALCILGNYFAAIIVLIGLVVAYVQLIKAKWNSP